ncbi:MAG: type II toxin-antitoxin system VapC family toxin [Cyanobacteria bacterium P01_F01_bin.143]
MIYLDTSFLAPFYIRETTSKQVENILLNIPPNELVISDWTKVEFASLLSRLVRMGELSKELVEAVITAFLEDVKQSYSVITITRNDFERASEFILQWDTGLRAGDALHLAIADNHRIIEQRIYYR